MRESPPKSKKQKREGCKVKVKSKDVTKVKMLQSSVIVENHTYRIYGGRQMGPTLFWAVPLGLAEAKPVCA